MKIATFNINNVNKRLANLLDWLNESRPDVVCLQELKAADAEFPRAAFERAGYGAIWRGQKSWNGVAILARGAEPIATRYELPGDPGDKQGRYIEAAVEGVIVTSLYAPNGNPHPGPKFDYKIAWLKRLVKHAARLHAAKVPVVLAGDYNVVPTDNDIYNATSSYANDALLRPESRREFERLLKQGWMDAIRTLHPAAPMFTFWDYMRNRWARDAGLRIDHLLLSPKAATRLLRAGVDRDVRGLKGASDHAPAWIELKGAGRQTRAVSSKSAGKSKMKRPATAKTRRPLLVVDGDSFAHRSYHALPKNIATRDGRPAGAVLGFANFLLRVYRNELPRAVLVGWDTLDKPTYRHQLFPAYQSGRKFDGALLEQLRLLPKLVEAFGFSNAKAAGYEADDFLAAATAAEEKRGGIVLIASGDRDTFQLASKRTTVLYPVRAGEMARVTPAEVQARYGVDPEQVPDFIALRGDPSDRLPGLSGVGATGAASLLRKYGSVEGLLAAGRYAAYAEQLRLFRSIATMDRKAPLPRLRDQKPDWARAAAFAEALGLVQLSRRLQAIAADKPV
jgi:exodeoxyribonuclease-3